MFLVYSHFAVLCLSSEYSHLIHLWHIPTAYLFFFGFCCHRGYGRRLSKVPCADHQVLPEYLLEIQISMYIWKEGRKERILLNYPLQIETSVYILALSPNSSLLFHFFLETSDSVWILRVAFFVVNLFHCISFCILPTRDIIYYCLSLCDWLHLVCDPPSSILVTIIGTISVAIFHDWVTVHCMYVHISFNL